jgi:hypothetical protein
MSDDARDANITYYSGQRQKPMSETEIIELIRRVLSRLEDIDRRLKNVELDVKRVKREVKS